MMQLSRLRFAVALLLFGSILFAQDKPKSPDPAEFKALKYRLLGPAWGGRVSRAVGVPGDSTTFYAATASGGVWKSSDGGITWRSIFDDQPISSIGSIAVAASDPNVVYVGSGEANIRGNVAAGNGIYKSTDAGKTWQTMKLNLPTVAVHDFAVKDNSLIVGTHGRSIWSFDHLNVLREWSPATKDAAAHLFAAPDAIRWRFGRSVGEKFSGQNPPNGAVIYYWLKEEQKGDVMIDILDANNNVVAAMSSKPRAPIGFGDSLEMERRAFGEMTLVKTPGIHLAVWNLAHNGSELVENAKLDFGGPVFGPGAVPGAYTVRLKVDGNTFTTKLNVLPDPRVQLTEAEYKAQRDFALAIRDDVSRLTLIVRQIRNVREQLSKRNDLLKNDAKPEQLRKDSEALIKKLDDLEAEIHNPSAEVVYDILAFKGGAKLYSRIAALHDFVADADGPPTQGAREVYADQKKELDGYDATMKKLLSELAGLNGAAKKLDLPHVIAP